MTVGYSGTSLDATPPDDPTPPDDISCIRFTASQFDAPDAAGSTALEDEWVRVTDFCGTDVDLTGWTVSDAGSEHSFVFPDGFSLRDCRSVFVRTGSGTDDARDLHWGESTEVWDRSSAERAYLRDPGQIVRAVWWERGPSRPRDEQPCDPRRTAEPNTS